ncbi:Cof-type HAD-IIB family hydrolase [Metabacillus herbersteinensis]|uniref:Cof-type HAD-IIB family hydrolase n=1 Tax=Metabacillus herbersteinensis TaxID=283816 RepID=A0ABV6GC71_9BACI
MNGKVIFFDIDGTLLDHNKQIPNSTRTVIQQLKDEGHHVAIATGRAPFMFEDLRKELGIQTFVSFNGQYVVFEGEVIYRNPLKTETLEHLLAYASEVKHPLVFMSEDSMMATMDNHPYIEESMGTLKFPHPISNPDFYKDHEIFQTLLFCKGGEEERYQHYQDLTIIRWHDLSTDILPFGGSKAEGIKQLMTRLNIDKDDIYAFGDGLNDLEMIEFVGTGVAMGNAVPSLKEVADYVTKAVDMDGISHGLKHLGLIK